MAVELSMVSAATGYVYAEFLTVGLHHSPLGTSLTNLTLLTLTGTAMAYWMVVCYELATVLRGCGWCATSWPPSCGCRCCT